MLFCKTTGEHNAFRALMNRASGTAEHYLRIKLFGGCTGLLIPSDNTADFNLNELVDAHQNRPKGSYSMLTFKTTIPGVEL